MIDNIPESVRTALRTRDNHTESSYSLHTLDLKRDDAILRFVNKVEESTVNKCIEVVESTKVATKIGDGVKESCVRDLRALLPSPKPPEPTALEEALKVLKQDGGVYYHRASNTSEHGYRFTPEQRAALLSVLEPQDQPTNLNSEKSIQSSKDKILEILDMDDASVIEAYIAPERVCIPNPIPSFLTVPEQRCALIRKEIDNG